MNVQINCNSKLLKDRDLLNLVSYNAEHWVEQIQNSWYYKNGHYSNAAKDIRWSGGTALYRPNVSFEFKSTKTTLYITIKERKTK